MGAYTLDNFADDLSLQFGNRGDLESPTNWLHKWTNKAYISLTTRSSLYGMPLRFYWPQLETNQSRTTTDGTAYVELPDDVLIIRRVFNATADNKLDWIAPDEYYRKAGRANTAQEGDPTKYTRIGNYLYLYPTPDDSATTITTFYRKVPAELRDTTDTTVLGAEWDEPIVGLAKIFGHTHLKEFDFAEALKAGWKEDVASLIDIYAQEQRASGKHFEVDNQIKSGY